MSSLPNRHSSSPVIRLEQPSKKRSTPRRVAAYCRVSTELKDQQSSIQTQKAYFLEYIRSHPGWELAGIYADEGISGTQAMGRAAFAQMTRDCMDGKIDLILTKSISRFARNTLECLSYVRQFRDMGVFILFEKENLNTEHSASELVLTIMASFAQEESRALSENVKWGIRRRFAEGIPKYTRVYGYSHEQGEPFLINKETAPVVRRIFQEYVFGRSLSQICRGLAADQIPSPAGNSVWRPKTVASILANEKYRGDVRMQKTYVLSHLTHKKAENDGSVIPGYYKSGSHEAIVDSRTFELVQIIRSLRDTHNGAVQYPYYGFLICPLCQRPMVRHTLAGIHGRPAVWHCMGEPDASEHPGCKTYYIREFLLHAAFRAAYRLLPEDRLRQAALEAAKAANARLSEICSTAIKLRRQYPDLPSVEYYMLDAMVDFISFPSWETMVVHWKFGAQTSVPVPYQKDADIPNHPAQLASAGSGRWSSYQKPQEPKPLDPNIHRRTCLYGNDTTVAAAYEQVRPDRRIGQKGVSFGDTTD